MIIVELRYPGVWIEIGDPMRASELHGMLLHLERCLSEATVALNSFLAAGSEPYMPRQTAEEREAEYNTRDEIERAVRADLAAAGMNPDDRQHWDAIREAAERDYQRSRQRQGHMPNALQNVRVFLYAKAFLAALDSMAKLLRALASEPDAPPALAAHATTFENTFPTLRPVRNSVQHVEDRIRGLGPGGKPLDLAGKPTPFVSASPASTASVLSIDILRGDQFGATMADGEYGEVAVTEASLRAARDVVQAAIDSFRWSGPASYYPT